MKATPQHIRIDLQKLGLRVALITAAHCLLAGSSLPARAQYQGGEGTTTLRSPLIPGAPSALPNQAPMEGPAPPTGSGMYPAPVTPGQAGGPLPPPSAVSLPATSPTDKQQVNQQVAPYLTPPASTPGEDPGILPENPNNGFQPPAAVVDINPQGGISGQAPIRKWGGQTTRDLGRYRTFGSQTTDFGTRIDNLPSVQQHGIKRSVSEDGPRPITPAGQLGSGNNRQENLAGATCTTDLHGNRSLFKGANLRSRMTIAPY